MRGLFTRMDDARGCTRTSKRCRNFASLARGLSFFRFGPIHSRVRPSLHARPFVSIVPLLAAGGRRSRCERKESGTLFPPGMGSMASNDRHAQDNQHAHKLRNVLSIASLCAAMSDDGGRAARRSIHARLLGCASGVALSVASVAVALGVCVPGAAQAQTTVIR